MVNFGYPYNDIVICKDSTDYLHGNIMFLFVCVSIDKRNTLCDILVGYEPAGLTVHPPPE